MDRRRPANYRAKRREFPDGRIEVLAILHWQGWRAGPRQYDPVVEAERTLRRAKDKCVSRCRAIGADHLLTLTYRHDPDRGIIAPTHEMSRWHVSQFMKRVRKQVESWQCVGVSEKTMRGVVHWHFGVKGYQPVAKLRAIWASVIWPEEGNIDVKFFSVVVGAHRFRDAASYIGKYLGKGFDGERPRYGHHYVTSRGIVVEETVSFRMCRSVDDLGEWVRELLGSGPAARWWVPEDRCYAGGESCPVS